VLFLFLHKVPVAFQKFKQFSSIFRLAGTCIAVVSRVSFALDASIVFFFVHFAGVQQIQPQLLECNFVPDYSRAFDYYPDIMNECFRFLYLGQDSKNFIDISDL